MALFTNKMTRDEYLKLQESRQRYLLSTANNGFRLVLTPNFEVNSSMTKEELAEIDKLNQPIEFDYISSYSVSSTSQITSYPMVNGDTVADHMIKQPISISISGKFSLYGNKPTTFAGDYDRLTNIEELFEKIQNEGVMCSLVTTERNGSQRRFKVRNKMVITSINWTEEQASLGFNFSFSEAMTTTILIPVVDYTDENLPAITDATTLSFTDELLNMEDVDKIVIAQLRELGLIEDAFLDNLVYWLKSVGSTYGDYLTGAAVGGLVGIGAGIAVLIGVAALVGSIPVAGWIIVAAAAVVGMIAGGIWAMVKSIKRKKAQRDYGIQVFKAYTDDKQNTQECERFCDYIGNIHSQLSALNDYIQVYGISSNEEQECMMYINDTYYIFTYKINNTETTNVDVLDENGQPTGKTIKKVKYSLNITDINDKNVGGLADISSAKSTISECNNDNYILKTEINHIYYVYLLNKNRSIIENDASISEYERANRLNECNSDLTNYVVMVTKLKMSEFNSKLQEIVVDAMKM